MRSFPHTRKPLIMHAIVPKMREKVKYRVIKDDAQHSLFIMYYRTLIAGTRRVLVNRRVYTKMA